MAEPQPTQEQWKPVPGYEGHYEVSDQGRVRSLDRVITTSRGAKRRYKGRVLKLANRGKYKAVMLGHGQRLKSVHRLVAEAFIGPCPDGAEVCHNDGNSANNRLGNLRYDTRKANQADRLKHGTSQRDMVRLGTHSMTRKTHCPRGHALDFPNLLPAATAKGKRECYACSLARGHVKRHPELDFVETADKYFHELQSGAQGEVEREPHHCSVKTHCPRGHLLDEPNNVASARKRGARSCLACSRARAYLQKHPELKKDIKAISDRYYETIMR